jgi:hypothetical protein
VCVFGNRLEPGTGGQDASPRAVAGVSLLPASCPEREPAVTGQALKVFISAAAILHSAINEFSS